MFVKSYKSDDDWIIEDTDFIEKIVNPPPVSGWELIVRVYEKKNLDVVKNLLLAMDQYDILTCFTHMDIFNYSDEHKEYYSKYLKYKEEVAKYLMLV
jgi:hypothetical protein